MRRVLLVPLLALLAFWFASGSRRCSNDQPDDSREGVWRAVVRSALADIGVPGGDRIPRGAATLWIRDAIRALGEQGKGARLVSGSRAMGEALQFDVLLVGDEHPEDGIRLGTQRLLREVKRRHSGRLALALEFLPSNMEQRLGEMLRRGAEDQVLEFFRGVVVWPVQELSTLAMTAHELGVDVLGAGLPVLPGEFDDCLPPAGTQDILRRQPASSSGGKVYRNRGGRAASTHGATVIANWLRQADSDAGPGSRVICLFGRQHIDGLDYNLRPSLVRLGYRVANLEIVQLGIERAIHMRWRRIAEDDWIAFDGDRFRAGLLSSSDWSSIAARRRLQFAALRAELPTLIERHEDALAIVRSVVPMVYCSPRRAHDALRPYAEQPELSEFREWILEWTRLAQPMSAVLPVDVSLDESPPR